MSVGKKEQEMNRQLCEASAVMQALRQTVMVKKELSRKAKLSIYQSIYVPTLTYVHQLWVMTERLRLPIQAAEWVSSVGWLGVASEIGWGARTSGGSSELSGCSFVSKEACWGGPGIWLGCLLDASLWRFSRHVQLEGDPGETQDSLEGLLYTSLGLGTTWVPPGGAWGCCWAEGCLEGPTELAATATWPQIRGGQWMSGWVDGWMDGWMYGCYGALPTPSSSDKTSIAYLLQPFNGNAPDLLFCFGFFVFFWDGKQAFESLSWWIQEDKVSQWFTT